MSENRKATNNFRLNNGTPEFGHKGDYRDERNLMWNVDPICKTRQLYAKNSPMLACAAFPVWFDSPNDRYISPA